MFCRSLFVRLHFFFWPLCCLFFFDIRFLIAPLGSSNFSCVQDGWSIGMYCHFQYVCCYIVTTKLIESKSDLDSHLTHIWSYQLSDPSKYRTHDLSNWRRVNMLTIIPPRQSVAVYGDTLAIKPLLYDKKIKLKI